MVWGIERKLAQGRLPPDKQTLSLSVWPHMDLPLIARARKMVSARWAEQTLVYLSRWAPRIRESMGAKGGAAQ